MSNRRDNDYLNWCEDGARYFSTCSRAQYMAIIVDRQGRVVGTGYNGGPPHYPHCTEGGCPHSDEPPMTYTKPCIAIHAEENALMRSDHDRRTGGTLYVNGIPCYSCALKLAGSGLGRVVYRMGERDHKGSNEGIALLRACGLVVETA